MRSYFPMQPYKNGISTTQHTLGHLDCPACESARTLTLARISPGLLFSEAAALWLQSRSFNAVPGSVSARYIRKTTEVSYAQYVGSLNLFFSELRLEQIHLGHLRAYQEARVTGAAPFIRKRRPNKNVVAAPCPASPKKANQELSILKMILRRAGCWTPEMDEFYEPFSVDQSEVPRALTPKEQLRWLDVSLLKPRWHLVYWYSVLAFETSMSTNEIRSLRIGDVNLQHRILTIGAVGSKNRYRQRTIPLHTASVLWATEQLLARAEDLGAVHPQHFLFPFRRPPAPFNPELPMTVSGMKRLWEEVRSASGIKWFRPYDTRHTAITRWAEGGIPAETIRAMAGHVSDRMMRHYTHISDTAKRRAFEALPKIGPASVRAPFYVDQLSRARR